MDDCQSFSSKPKWMERECQRLMCLMARRDIEIENESHTKDKGDIGLDREELARGGTSL